MAVIACDNPDIASTFEQASATYDMQGVEFNVTHTSTSFSLHGVLLHEATHPIYVHDFIKTCVLHYQHHRRAAIINVAGYALDATAKTLTGAEVHIELTDKEMLLLKALVTHAEPMHKDALIKAMWQQQTHVDSGSFDTHLYRLRQKTDGLFEILCSNNHYEIVQKHSAYSSLNF